MKEKPSKHFAPSAAEYWSGIQQLSEQGERQDAGLRRTVSETGEQLAERIQNGAEGLSKELGELQTSLTGEISAHDAALKSLCRELNAKNDQIIGGISGLYNLLRPVDVRFEREYYKDFPTGTSEAFPDFREKLLKLLDGLDEASVESVVLSLQRLKLIRASAEPAMFLYSEEEIRRMAYLAEHFYSNVLELSPECFYFRGFQLPANHFEACVFADKLMLPELAHPERFRDKDIIDAGAFIGDSALILAPLTERKVYAFEPTPGNFDRMLKTIEMNRLTNVVPEPFALGEKEDAVKVSVNDSASTQFENQAFQYQASVEVECVALDDFVQEHDLHVGLIKADVEGAEQLMLRGAIHTLREQRPALLISIYHNASDFFAIKPMLEALDLGYQFKIRHSVGGTVMTETVLIAETR